MKADRYVFVVSGALLLAPLFPAMAGQAQGNAAGAQNLPAGEGKDVLVKTCTGCHALSVVTSQHKTEDGWIDTVVEMRNRGANGTDEDMETVVRYLTANFGPQSGSTTAAKVNVNSATASDMVSGLSLTQTDADAIVAYRDKNGKFKDIAGLKQVPGIDAAKIDAAKDKIDF